MPKVDWITRIVLLMCLAANTIGEQRLNACCSKTGYPACRAACMRLVSPSPSYTYKYYHFSDVTKRLAEFVSNCPRSEVDFWSCLHQWQGLSDFTSDSKKNVKSEHLDCCSYANHVSCQLHCLTTKNITYLENENCGKSREEKLNKCLAKVYAHDHCCDDSEGPQCKRACVKYFKDSSASPFDQNMKLEKACGRKSQVFKCAVKKSGFKSAVEAFTTCCKKSNNVSCKKACEQQFSAFSRDDKLSRLTQHCGEFDTQDPMYSCILRAADSSKDSQRQSKAVYQERTVSYPQDPVESQAASSPESRMTNMKDQCCSRAKSRECRVWCAATISMTTMMGLWDTMYLQCIQDPKEVELSSCMNDMLEPCQLSGYFELKFCTAFNNRPLESFRRFSAYGDSHAKKIYDIWAEGTVKIFGYELVFKDINTCLPESWKAIACLLAVSPCSHKRKQTQVCRQDCKDLLDTCLDHSKMTNPVSTMRVCSLLLRNDNQSGCVSVKDYLNPVVGGTTNHQVALPCSPNPCKTGEVCSINRSCTSEAKVPCKMYSCLKGCPVSGDSNLLVPVGAFAKLVQETEDGRSYQVCKCASSVSTSTSFPMTYFDKCKYFGSEKEGRCTFYGRSWDNGARFYDACNMCTCSSGSIICTKRQCVKTITNSNARPRRHHANDASRREFPCDCHDNYNPMCASNGVTYPNLCLARCAKFEDMQINVGDCQSVDPCDPNPCLDRGLTCVPKRSSCLASNSHCPQYKCWFGISEYFSDDECPSNNQIPAPVCGYDAATYSSMCHANLAGVGVDYNGTCSTNGYSNDLADRCLSASCSTLGETQCTKITPPGACCPVCGSILRILYSEQDLRRHQDFISYQPVTVKDVVEKIRMQIVVAGCEAYGYVSVEGDLVIIVKVGSSYKISKEHFQACATEAERLNAYINDQSPQVTTKYYLSMLKASQLQSSQWTNVKSSASKIISSLYIVTLIELLIICDVFR